MNVSILQAGDSKSCICSCIPCNGLAT